MNTPDFAKATATDTDQIPVIDVSGAVDGTDIKGVAQAIHAAAMHHGFFYISGHGIDPQLMEQAFKVSKDFFALPTDQKQTVEVGTDQRGWMAQGMSKLAGAKTHDLKD